MYAQNMKCERALSLSIARIKKMLTVKALLVSLFFATTIGFTSCTAFEDSYYPQDQVDGDLGPGCKIVNDVVVCP